ncbi:MAG TPA: dethiobiotin synthase [Actinomycetota bacterium]|nr:dethiobiotin synthase [Actinomycetota bacterium]
MPDLVVFVAGTGTEVGKTWAGAEIARALRADGHEVHARKPLQSFEERSGPTDADVLAEATGEDPAVVCLPHRWLPLPMAPPMAAEALGHEPLALEDVVADVDLPASGIVLVEGVGGPRSPVTDDGDNVDLARAIGAQVVVLVAHAGLGTINEVVLSSEAFGSLPLVVFLNRYDDADDLHLRNRRWLAEVCGIDAEIEASAVADRLVAHSERAVPDEHATEVG